MKSKLIAYAMDFSSFLIQKIKQKEEIKNIILFGSVAREEAEKTSDVDIFIDVVNEKKIEKELNKISEDFSDSVKFKNYWKPLGIENKINISVGELDKWGELKSSIISNGIVLYGKFKSDIEGEHKTFFIWENVKPNSKRVLFNKQLFGYMQKGKFYDGLIQKFKGKRLGKGCVVVPLEHSKVFHNLFKKHKITVRMKKIVEYV